MKCQSLFSAKSKKNITNLSSAEFAHGVVKVKQGIQACSYVKKSLNLPVIICICHYDNKQVHLKLIARHFAGILS